MWIMEIKVRGLDPMIIKKIDEEVVNHGYGSRNEFMVDLITNYAAYTTNMEVIERYESLSKNVITAISELTNIIIKKEGE